MKKLVRLLQRGKAGENLEQGVLAYHGVEMLDWAAEAIPEGIKHHLVSLSGSAAAWLVGLGIAPHAAGALLLGGCLFFLIRRSKKAGESDKKVAEEVWATFQQATEAIQAAAKSGEVPEGSRTNPFLLIYAAISDQTGKLEELIEGDEAIKAQLGSLLVTGSEIADELKGLRTAYEGSLRRIERATTYPPMVTLEFKPGYRPGETNRLVFRNRPTPLEGRGNELGKLLEFLMDREPFAWWLWYGPAGTGKSRLALDFIQFARSSGWDAAFYDRKANWSKRWQDWEPERKTLIVFDYARELATDIKEAIAQLSSHPTKNKIRFLLLERTGDTKEPWYEDSLGRLDNQDTRYHFPYRLEPLGIDDYLKVSYPVYKARASEPVEFDEFEAKLKPGLETLLRHAQGDRKEDLRPLAALFVAEAVADAGFEHVREWNLESVAKFWLKHELEHWKDQGVTDQTINLLILATALGGFNDGVRQEMATEALKGLIPEGRTVPGWEAIRSSSISEREFDFPPLEPDILGEALTLQRLENSLTVEGCAASVLLDETIKVLQHATKVNTWATGIFVLRCGQDFPHHPRLPDLLFNLDSQLMPVVRGDVAVSVFTAGNEELSDRIVETLSAPDLRSKTLIRMGVALGGQERFEEAIGYFAQVIDMQDASPEHKADALLGKGANLMITDRTEESIACFRQTLEVEGADPRTQMLAAETLEMLQRLAEEE